MSKSSKRKLRNIHTDDGIDGVGLALEKIGEDTWGGLGLRPYFPNAFSHDAWKQILAGKGNTACLRFIKMNRNIV